MQDLRENGYVRFVGGENEGLTGIVSKIGRKYISVIMPDNTVKKFFPAELEYIPPQSLTEEQVRKLIRFELKNSDIIKMPPDHIVYAGEGVYHVTLEDISAALENMKKSGLDCGTIADEWFCGMIHHSNIYDFADRSPDRVFGLPDDGYVMNRIRDVIAENSDDLLKKLRNIPDKDFSVLADELSEYLGNYIADKHKPLSERRFTTEEKLDFIGRYDNKILEISSHEVVKLYRKFVDELADHDYTARKHRACGHFGGNAAFECDYSAALNDLLLLFEHYPLPETAWKIGYIYYKFSGDFEKAFRYLSIAADGENILARIFLSEMYLGGKGVPQSDYISGLMSAKLGYELKNRLYANYFEYAVFLISRMTCTGSERYHNDDNDYADRLRAHFALKASADMPHEYPGEKELLKTAEEKVRAAKNGRLEFYSVHELFNNVLRDAMSLRNRHIWEMKYKRLKNGDHKLTFRILPRSGIFNEKNVKMFVCIPEFGFCGYLDELSVRLTDIEIFEVSEPEKPVCFDFDDYRSTDNHSDFNGTVLSLYGSEKAVVGGRLILESPVKKNDKKYRFISAVPYSGCTEEYTLFRCDDETVTAGNIIKIHRPNLISAEIIDGKYEEFFVTGVYEKTEYELEWDIGEYIVNDIKICTFR